MTPPSCVYTVTGREVGLKARRSGTSTPTPPGRLRPSSTPQKPEALRTFALAGHRSAGKTSLAEMLLQAGRVVREPGEVASGTTLLDWTPTERRHRLTIELATAWFDWDGVGLQLLDTPGAACFSHARDLALENAEAAVIVVDAAAGVEIGTEEALATARRVGLPVVVVLAKADRLRSELDLEPVSRASGMRAVALQLPFHDDSGALRGVVDVLRDRVLRFADDGAGTWSPEPVPERLRAAVAVARERVTEAVAVTDDALLEQYLEYLELPIETVRQALVTAVRRRAVAPVLLASAAARVGAGPLLDALAELVPPIGEIRREVVEFDGTRQPLLADGPFVARVLSEHRDEDGEPWHLVRVLGGAPPTTRGGGGDWIEGRSGDPHRVRKCYRVRGPRRQALADVPVGAVVGTWDPLPAAAGTTLTDGRRWEVAGAPPPAPMMAFVVRPEEERHRARVDEGLLALVRADRGLALHSDGTSGEVLLAGADEAHLRLSIERLEAWTGVRVRAELPPVGYVETPARSVEGIEGVHVRNDGDGLVEEYGRCEITLDTGATDGLEFEDTIGDVEDDLPRRFRPAVDEGARAAMRHGPTAGYPVVGVRLTLTGGDYDLLQSTDEHFRLAGEKAVRAALERAGTRLLEPWRTVAVTTPATALGNVVNDVSAHRGRVLGITVDGDTARIEAATPYRELRTFAPRLQTLTGGRGRYEVLATHYEPVPNSLVDEAIRSSPHGVRARTSARPQRTSNAPGDAAPHAARVRVQTGG